MKSIREENDSSKQDKEVNINAVSTRKNCLSIPTNIIMSLEENPNTHHMKLSLGAADVWQ